MSKTLSTVVLASALCGLLTGCPGGGAIADPSNGKGVLQGWPSGNTGTINFVGSAGSIGSPELLSSSNVDSQGRFSYTLKTPTNLITPFIQDPICTGKLTISDPAAKGVGTGIFATTTEGDEKLVILANTDSGFFSSSSKAGDTLVSFSFFDRDVTVSGTQTCGTGDTPLIIIGNQKFTKGWNLGVSIIKEVRKVGTTNIVTKMEVSTAGSIPGDVKFVYGPSFQAAKPLHGLRGFIYP